MVIIPRGARAHATPRPTAIAIPLVSSLIALTVGLEAMIPATTKASSARAGVVRLEGRTFVDDGGAYLAVGASLFWALWGYQHDRQRLEKHLDYLSRHGVDYIRVFGVIGPRWADRIVDPRDRAWDQNLA